MLVASTPETTNPVADQCEANGVPCISSVAPWQPWFFGRQRRPREAGFEWTYHFFWGLEDIIAVFIDMWSQVDTNKVVGALWPNDGDGNAWGDKKLGFPPALAKAGYKIVDPGRYQNGTEDFSAQIAKFKAADVEIVTGVPIPPDLTTFWKQAAQQGFQPKIASVGKALLFPRLGRGPRRHRRRHVHRGLVEPRPPLQVVADRGQRRPGGRPATRRRRASSGPSRSASSTPCSRSPPPPSRRPATSTTSRPLVDAIKARQPRHGRRARSPGAGGPVPNVAKTPLVGGQWRKSDGDGTRSSW